MLSVAWLSECHYDTVSEQSLFSFLPCFYLGVRIFGSGWGGCWHWQCCVRSALFTTLICPPSLTRRPFTFSPPFTLINRNTDCPPSPPVPSLLSGQSVPHCHYCQHLADNVLSSRVFTLGSDNKWCHSSRMLFPVGTRLWRVSTAALWMKTYSRQRLLQLDAQLLSLKKQHV